MRLGTFFTVLLAAGTLLTPVLSARTVYVTRHGQVGGKKYYVGYTKEYVKVAKASKVPLDNCLVTGNIVETLSEEVYLMD